MTFVAFLVHLRLGMKCLYRTTYLIGLIGLEYPMAKKVRWVKHLHMIPPSTWLTCAQMSDMMRSKTDVGARALSIRLRAAVAMKAGIQVRMVTHDSREYSIHSHSSLIAYLTS